MRTRSAIHSLLVGALALVVGCNKYSMDTYWRSENYRLIAIDARGQMSLVDTSDKSWEGIGPTVFSIGADDKFIVVAQHPSSNAFGDFDRSVTQYFIVERIQRSGYAEPGKRRSRPIDQRGI